MGDWSKDDIDAAHRLLALNQSSPPSNTQDVSSQHVSGPVPASALKHLPLLCQHLFSKSLAERCVEGRCRHSCCVKTREGLDASSTRLQDHPQYLDNAQSTRQRKSRIVQLPVSSVRAPIAGASLLPAEGTDDDRDNEADPTKASPQYAQVSSPLYFLHLTADGKQQQPPTVNNSLESNANDYQYLRTQPQMTAASEAAVPVGNLDQSETSVRPTEAPNGRKRKMKVVTLPRGTKRGAERDETESGEHKRPRKKLRTVRYE